MVYEDVVNALVTEVSATIREHGFHAAFSKAPSRALLRESEVDAARREIAARLGKGKKKNHLRTTHTSIPLYQQDLFVHFPFPQ